MGINKVNYGNTTLIDISNDTVTAGSMLSGTTAHDNSGAAITGTIASKSSSDLTASGATVTVPAGHYASQASKAVATGTAGTPTATKGTVSNHAVSVTPSVTNTTGYITGSTKTGTAVTVSASELVSGNKEITSNGTGIDVANYSTVSVDVSADPSLRELTVNPTSAVQVFYPSDETLKGTITYSGTVYGSSDNTVTHSLGLTNGNLYRVDGYFSYSGTTVAVSGTYACGTVIYSSSSWKLTLNTNTLIVHNYLSRYDGFVVDIDVYSIDEYYDGFSKVTVNAASGGSVGTKTVTNSSTTNTSLSFSSLSGEPKAFFVRCLSQLTRSSSYSYYYITAIRYNGTNTNGNYWRMSNGTFYADTSHYSFTYSNGTLTVSSSGARGSAGGSFYNGDYELTYFY